MHTVQECAAARKWAWEQGAARWLWFEKGQWQKKKKNSNMLLITESVAQFEVWGNHDVTDGDLIHGWDMDRSDLEGAIARYPRFIGKMHGDGTSGDMVTIVPVNEPPIVQKHKYWRCVLPGEAGFRSLREEVGMGKEWNTLLNATWQEPHLAASLPAEDQQILWHIVAHHNLNPSQALAVRHCLDEGAIVSCMTGGAGTGKSETLVACIKAVMLQQGLFDPCIRNPKKPHSIHTGKKGGGGGT